MLLTFTEAAPSWGSHVVVDAGFLPHMMTAMQRGHLSEALSRLVCCLLLRVVKRGDLGTDQTSDAIAAIRAAQEWYPQNARIARMVGMLQAPTGA